jgi:hypothetical protein
VQILSNIPCNAHRKNNAFFFVLFSRINTDSIKAEFSPWIFSNLASDGKNLAPLEA